MSLISTVAARVALGATLCVGLALAAVGTAQALPSQLTVQGSLSDSSGTASNGDFTLLVSLYDTQGAPSAFWAESHTVTVVGGLFDVVLGADTLNPLTIADFSGVDQVWLGLQLIGGPGVPAEGEAELPRRLLSSSAYAFVAGNAQTATTADTAADLDCSGCVSIAELDFDPATQAELDALTGVTSVDGLTGGQIEGAVTVNGSVAATAVRQNGNQVCDSSGNCGAMLANLTCAGDGVATYSAMTGMWSCGAAPSTSASDVACSGCVSESELDFDPITASELMMTLASYAMTDDLLPTPPACSGDDQALKWNGTAFTCTTTTPEPPVCTGDNDVLRYDGSAWSCVTNTASAPPKCDGPFQALQYDGSNWVCNVIKDTGLSNGRAKGFEARDSWGYAWDGIERQGATWEDASMQCQQLGGRLPTLTELYRVSGGGTSEVGNTYTTNDLWSRTQWSTTQHGRVRLTDGRTQGQTSTSVGPFRCVWPNNTENYFMGNHCYGPPGTECVNPSASMARYHVDAWERPPGTYMAAIDECNFYHAHLPQRIDYDELIGPEQLANGTNSWLYTADASRYDIVDRVRWTDTATDYNPASGTWTGWAGKTNVYRFRCIGVNYAAGVHPNAVDGTQVVDTTYLKMDEVDRNPDGGFYADAVTDCFERGGHLAMQRDYEEAVRNGVPRDTETTTWLWTADATEHRNQNVVRWSGTNTSFSAQYSGEATWAGRFNLYAHRCVYYPLDAAYEGPEDCVQDFTCFTTERGGDTKSKMWADPADRSPATYQQAVETCHAEGGRLAHSRDLTELIRAGLALGSDTYLWTSDATEPDGTHVLVVKWADTESLTDMDTDNEFDLNYSSNATRQSKATSNTSPYRCVWTNELR